MRELNVRFASLSEREREVMSLVNTGLMNKQIAGEMSLSEVTVKVHRHKLMRKLGAKSVPELVKMAKALERTACRATAPRNTKALPIICLDGTWPVTGCASSRPTRLRGSPVAARLDIVASSTTTLWSRRGLGDLIRSLGYPARVFESAEQFVDSGSVDDNGCLITDLHMPGLSGLDLQDRLRRDGHRIPVIILTAYPEERHRALALRGGVTGDSWQSRWTRGRWWRVSRGCSRLRLPRCGPEGARRETEGLARNTIGSASYSHAQWRPLGRACYDCVIRVAV